MHGYRCWNNYTQCVECPLCHIRIGVSIYIYIYTQVHAVAVCTMPVLVCVVHVYTCICVWLYIHMLTGLHDCACVDICLWTLCACLLCWIACLHNMYKESCNCVLPPAVSCGPAPNASVNGERSGSGTTFRSTVNYTCNQGYTLQGDGRRTCMANGQWSGVTTRCSRKNIY